MPIAPPDSSRGNVFGYHTAAQKKALTSQAASNQGAACFGAHVCAHNEALGCASERVSGHQANMNPALNAPGRTRTRVPGFEPGTFGFVDRCDGDARSDVSADKHDNNSDQEKNTTGGARTSLHTMGDMDPLLSQLVSQWDTLPGPVRKAIAALLECDQ